MTSMSVAGAQFHSEYADKQYNLKKIENLCNLAKNKGVDFILFPELSITGFIIDANVVRVAEAVPGPSTEYLAQVSRRLKIVVGAGLIESQCGLNYNTMVLVGPSGLIGKYRKVHLPFVEYPWYTSGSTFPVFDVLGWKVGLSTCCDNLFPEHARILSVRGTEIILAPFCWLYEGDDSFPLKLETEPAHNQVRQWIRGNLLKLLPARAYENGVYVVAVNQYGWIGKTQYYATGGVLILGPDGKVLAEDNSAVFSDEIVIGNLKHQKLTEWRSRGNFSLKLRRPELYGVIVQRK